MSASLSARDRRDQLVAEFAALRPRLLSTALRILRDLDEAEDAVQDAYLSAWRALGEFRAEARLSTWIYRIVVNACLMRIRARKRRGAVAADAEALPVAPARRDDPGRDVEDRDTLARVLRLAERLPDGQRSALTRILAAELGQTTPRDSDAEKMRRHRARSSLRALLSGAELQ